MIFAGNSNITSFRQQGLEAASDEPTSVNWVGALQIDHFLNGHPAGTKIRRLFTVERGWKFLSIGTHDIFALCQSTLQGKQKEYLAYLRELYHQIFSEFHASGRFAWLVFPQPLRQISFPSLGPQDIHAIAHFFYDAIGAVCKELNIPIIDPCNSIVDKNGDPLPQFVQRDGIHLNVEGIKIYLKKITAVTGVAINLTGHETPFEPASETESFCSLLLDELGIPFQKGLFRNDFNKQLIVFVTNLLRDRGLELEVEVETELVDSGLLDSLSLVQVYTCATDILKMEIPFDIDLRTLNSVAKIGDFLYAKKEKLGSASKEGLVQQDFFLSLRGNTADPAQTNSILEADQHIAAMSDDLFQNFQREVAIASHGVPIRYGVVLFWIALNKASRGDYRGGLEYIEAASDRRRAFPFQSPRLASYIAEWRAKESDPNRRKMLWEMEVDASVLRIVSQDHDEWKEEYRKILALAEQGDLHQSILYLESLARNHPRVALFANDLGVLYTRLDDKTKALVSYQNAVSLEPTNITFLKNFAEFLYVKLGDVTGAFAMYTRALGVKPDDVETLSLLGRICLLDLKHVEDAKPFLSRAASIDPKNTAVREMLAVINTGHARPSGGQTESVEPPNDIETLIRTDDGENDYLVTALVSTYNSERFIKGCLEDLEAQTIADKIEIIVIDSSSQQNENAIVREFQQRFPNIVYLRTRRRETIYAAWNRGIRMARGKYITNTNTDDRRLPYALEVEALALDQNPQVGMVYADIWGTTIENDILTSNDTARYQLYSYPDFTLLNGLTGSNFSPQPMWRKDCHKAVGYFDDSYVIAGDYDFFYRLARRFGALHIKTPLGLYLANPSGIEKSQPGLTREEFTRLRKHFYSEISLDEFFPTLSTFHGDPLARGWAFFELGNNCVLYVPEYELAEVYYTQALSILGHLPQLVHNLAIAQIGAGDVKRGIATLKPVANILPASSVLMQALSQSGGTLTSMARGALQAFLCQHPIVRAAREGKGITIKDLKIRSFKHNGRLLSGSKMKTPEAVTTINPEDDAIREILDTVNSNKSDLKALTEPVDSQKEYLVSALVSTYNSEHFIGRCLEDLEAQTIADKIEIIVIDSGSTQNEKVIVEKMQKKYNNIKYIRTEEKETVYAAWNRGINGASGKYLTNANTDDRHRRDAFEKMVQVLESNSEIALVYADVLITEKENETFDDHSPAGEYRWQDWDRNSLLEGCFIGPQPMWRRSIHNQYGYFDDRMTSSGDYEFWLRISQTNDFYHVREPLGLYLNSPTSIEHRSRKEATIENTKILTEYRNAANSGLILKFKCLEELKQLVLGHQSHTPEVVQACVANLSEIAGIKENSNVSPDWTANDGEYLRNCIEASNYQEAFILLRKAFLVAKPDSTLLEQFVSVFSRIMLNRAKWWVDRTCFIQQREIENVLAAVNHDATAGKWNDAAKTIYELLKKYPDAGVAYAALGSLFIGKGDLNSAIEPLEKAVKLLPNEPSFGVQLAKLYRTVGLQEKAAKQIINTVNIAPTNPEALFTFATIAAEIGNGDAARATLSKLAQIEPNHPGMNELQKRLGQKGKQTAGSERMVDENPEELLKRGNAFLAASEWQKAINDFERVITLLPNDASELYPCLGYAYSQIGRFDKVVACYMKVLMTNPRSARAYYNLGKAYKDLGDFDSAKSCYTYALKLEPYHVDSCFNLANLNREMGMLDDAIFLYKKTLKLSGKHLGALCNMGVAYREKGDLCEAEKICIETIAIKPDFADAHWNLGLIRLLRGDFQEGWKGYEWRWQKGDYAHAKRNFEQPQWDGSDLAGKTILVHAEQGMGDMIQCMRFFPLLAQRGAKVVVECQKELATLARTVQGVQEVILRGEPLPSFDIHCPVMTLPAFFVHSLEQIPAAVPYVSLDGVALEKWRSMMKKDPAPFKIGIVWAGNQLYKNDMNRSCPVAIFSKLFDVEGVSFYSLQKGDPSGQLREAGEFGNVIDVSVELNDFMDTACLMECLDLVITVDTAAAHLAGSLGKLVWNLLPFAPDWRWMLTRENSSWYPTMRLFRQKTPRDWEGLIDSVREALQNEVRNLSSKNNVETADPGGVSSKQPSRAGFTSIVLFDLHQRQIVEQCLSSIKLNTPEPHEVIFLAGIDDVLIKWLKHETASHPNYRIVQTVLPSEFSKGCNHAIQESTGDYLVLMSADCIVPEHWLSDMVAFLTQIPDAGIVGPVTNLEHGLQKTDIVQECPTKTVHDTINSFRMRNHHRRIPTGKVAGFCMLFKRSLTNEIGFFDEKLGPQTYADDYCLRATLLGHKNLIAGGVYIHGRSSKEIPGTTLSDRKILKNKWGNIDRNSTLGQKLVVMTTIQQAWGFHLQDQTDKAAELLLQEIKRAPDGRELFYNLAEMLLESKRFKDALDVLTMMSHDDSDIRKLILTGYCREGLDHHEDAEQTAAQVLISGQYVAMALNLRGAVAFKKGDYSKAEAFFHQAVDCDPGYGEPYINLGKLKLVQKRNAEALDFFEKGFILSSTIPDIAISYYSSITSEKAWKRAERVLQEAKSLHPLSRRIAFFLIELQLRQEEYDSAMHEIEEALIRFGIDDGIINAALAVRKKIGPLTIRKTSKPGTTLSLCMIVKNEIRYLAKCLNSVKAVVDEMIVVDTGSTDRTKDIAEVFGAQLYDFPWTGDFSEARNYSLAQASGDWILVLDGDEVISRQDLAELRSLVARPNATPLAYSFVTRNYLHAVHNIGWIANDGVYSEEEAGSGWVGSTKVRMFSRDRRIRFTNPVHELLEPSLKKTGVKIRESSVPIHHYGKLDMDFDISKGQEYYLLGKKKLEEKGNDLDAIQELAIQAAGLGKHEEARDLWQQALNIQPDMLLAHINIANTYLNMNNFGEALTSAKRAHALRPDIREVVCNYAVCEMYAGDIERSVEVLETFIGKDKEYPMAFVMLLAAYFASGRKDKGSELLTSLKLTGSSAFGDAFLPFINKLIEAERINFAYAILEALVEHKISSDSLSTLHEKCTKKLLIEVNP